MSRSDDGIHWTDPVITMQNDPACGWMDNLNRNHVLKKDDGWHMWFTGQARGRSYIGYARSDDGLTWRRVGDQPVMWSERPFEGPSIMDPFVMWDEDMGLFRIWYTAGEQYEPNAIGYATSPDGIQWTKYENNPIFAADPKSKWEQHKVTAGQIVKRGEWYYMFYIGFENEHLARIGIARSKDGINNWVRMKNNPIVSPDQGKWDADACYKPFAIYDEKDELWRLWYNGRKGGTEQIGLVTHQGEDLGFDE